MFLYVHRIQWTLGCLDVQVIQCMMLFGLAVLVGGIASPSLYVVILAGDGITLAARV